MIGTDDSRQYTECLYEVINGREIRVNACRRSGGSGHEQKACAADEHQPSAEADKPAERPLSGGAPGGGGGAGGAAELYPALRPPL